MAPKSKKTQALDHKEQARKLFKQGMTATQVRSVIRVVSEQQVCDWALEFADDDGGRAVSVQEVRTALAHSAPDLITQSGDVLKKLLKQIGKQGAPSAHVKGQAEAFDKIGATMIRIYDRVVGKNVAAASSAEAAIGNANSPLVGHNLGVVPNVSPEEYERLNEESDDALDVEQEEDDDSSKVQVSRKMKERIAQMEARDAQRFIDETGHEIPTTPGDAEMERGNE